MVLLGVEGSEVGAWLSSARTPSLGQGSGGWVACAGSSSVAAAPEGSASPQLTHTCLTCGTRGIRPFTSTPQVSEGGRLLQCLAEAPFSAVSAQRWRWRQVLFRGVYSPGLANPSTGNVRDCCSGSPCSPSLQQQISASGSTGPPGDLRLLLGESTKVTDRGKFKPAV